jgi:hypothetical protein
MSEAEKWAKFVFNETIDSADITNHEPMYSIMRTIVEEKLKGTAVFSDGAHARYLTPNAARRCALQVRSHSALLLDQAEVAMESPEWSCGDPDCRDWLLSE